MVREPPHRPSLCRKTLVSQQAGTNGLSKRTDCRVSVEGTGALINYYMTFPATISFELVYRHGIDCLRRMERHINESITFSSGRCPSSSRLAHYVKAAMRRWYGGWRWKNVPIPKSHVMALVLGVYLRRRRPWEIPAHGLHWPVLGWILVVSACGPIVKSVRVAGRVRMVRCEHERTDIG